MSGIENILKRFYEVNGGNPLTSTSVQKSNAIATMLYNVQETSQPANYNSLVERMISILKQMSNLQLTVFSESLTPTSMSQALEPIPSPPRLDIPRSQPVKSIASRGYTPIDNIIRRIVRRFRFRQSPQTQFEQTPVDEAVPKPEPVHEPETVTEPVNNVKQLKPKPAQKIDPVTRTSKQTSWPQYSRKVSQSIPYVQASYPRKTRFPGSDILKPSKVPSFEPDLSTGSEIPTLLVPDEFKVPRTLLAGESAIPVLPPIPPSPLDELKKRASKVGLLGSVFAEKAAFFMRREVPQVQQLIQRMTDSAGKVSKIPPDEAPDIPQAGIQLLRAPSVLKTIQLSTRQIFQQTLRARQSLVESAEGSPRVLSELESTQVIERILDESDTVSQVIERERESRAALVTAQVDKVSRELSERVSETYQRGVSSLLPGYMGTAAGHLALAPSMGKMSTTEMTEMSEKMASLYSHQEAFEERARHVTSSHPFQQFLLVSQQVTDMAGEADGLGFLSDTIGELASSVPYYGQPPSPAMMQVSRQMEELATAAQASKVASMFTELTETQIRTEQLLRTPIEGVVSSIMDAPVGADALDRIILDTSSGYPSLKLHEVIPVIQRMAQSPARIPEPVSRPRPTFDRQKPAEFREEQRIDEIDMKELEKKIARILKDEARRYGVY